MKNFSRTLALIRRNYEPKVEYRMVYIHLVLSDGSKYRTHNRLPRYDADLILYGLGSEYVPAFLIRVLGNRRVVRARLEF